MSTFTAIVEYWHEGDQNYRVETFKRPTKAAILDAPPVAA